MGIAKGIRRLGVRKKPTGWYIVDAPVYYADGKPHTSYGPYDSEKDAINDRDGIQRTLERIGFDDEEPGEHTPTSKFKHQAKRIKQPKEDKQAPIPVEKARSVKKFSGGLI